MGRSAIRASAAFFVHFCVSFLSVMILQLVLVFLTRCSSAQGTTDARLMIKVGCEYDHDPGYVRHAGTSNTIWVQHGDNLPISRDGLPLDDVTNKGFSFYFPSNQQISARNTKTLVWTTGDDALLVDRFVLHAHDDRRSWGYENAYGWCLSTDHWNDAAAFNWENWDDEGNIHVVPDWRCYTLLELNPDGLVYYYYDDTYTPHRDGRRALIEEAGIPSVEDVKACQDDPATDTDQDCGPMVKEILNWEVKHWTRREASHQDGDKEDTPDTDVGNTDTETATDDRRVLSAVNRRVKA